MSADVLREAAALMRSRAEAATPGPWEVGDWWHVQGASHCQCDRQGPLVWEGRRYINGVKMIAHVHRRESPIGSDVVQATVADGYPTSVTVGNDWGPAANDADAAHIAAADPPFMLAVAQWLETFADCVADDEQLAQTYMAESTDALAVANTYLGRTS